MRFSVLNQGDQVHVFQIEGRGVTRRTDPLECHQVATVDLSLAPGRYTVFCLISDHPSCGMAAERVVQ